MFERIVPEEWQMALPGLAFFLFFVVFLYVTLRVTRMSKKQREHLADLPLQEEKAKKEKSDGESGK